MTDTEVLVIIRQRVEKWRRDLTSSATSSTPEMILKDCAWRILDDLDPFRIDTLRGLREELTADIGDGLAQCTHKQAWEKTMADALLAKGWRK